MVKINSHWRKAMFTFVLTVVAAGILLPLIRAKPEPVHEYFNGLNDWIRIAFVFFLSVISTGMLYKLLSPQIRHLSHCLEFPPTWLTALLGWIVAAVIDLFGGFDSDGYSASKWEWLGYGGGSLIIVSWYYGFWSDLSQWIRELKIKQNKEPQGVTLQDIESASWAEIETWLDSDAQAQYDFLGNQSVAHRVSLLVSDGTRSIGIVGPFGSGKSSIVKWVEDRLKRYEINGRQFFISYHSSWGFESSTSAIHDILSSAVSKVSAKVDTFQVDSLPESYRQMFSAGGNWVEAISNLVLKPPSVIDQFTRLSDLLKSIDGRLVIIVEDLDRNETRNFVIQEVLAFLERLKEHSNFSFILTGGLSHSERIDYAKLCDHIEYLATIHPHQSSALIEKVRQRCLDNAIFPHYRFDDRNSNFEWNPLSGMFMRDYDELSLPQAVAMLLSTPRSLRLALGHTFFAWKTLYGEIYFYHLLSINILRFGAPECFEFLLRRWDRLNSPPNQNPSFGQERVERIRQSILNDWNSTIRNVEWNAAAALQVMEFILPASEYWLVDDSRTGHSQIGQQYISEERYWLRSINEAIEEGDVRDQEIIRDIQAWLDAPSMEAELVEKLTSSPRYSDVWENIASSFFANRRDDVLLLCEHTIRRILSDQGAFANHDSQGFIHTWRFATSRITIQSDNRAWLEERITEAANISIEMVNGLWHYYGSPGNRSILESSDHESVRLHILDSLQTLLTDGSILADKLSPNSPTTLYDLVFGSGSENRRILVDVESWSWLGLPVLDALRNGNLTTAINFLYLLSTRQPGTEQAIINTEVLDSFFGGNALETIEIIGSMIDQLPDFDQEHATNVIGAAYEHLTG
ncbi:P-loop NTPase fold protein [Gimesia sp.]|uniref:P-loop NTPase fold protein n=1 Tax=Gimesia sp. TaxID=2024833 RepID=UPI003A92AEE5